MNKNKTVGLIGTGVSDTINEGVRISRVEGFNLKKIFVTNKIDAEIAQAKYPQVEIVHDSSAIIHDELIDLVLLSAHTAKDMEMVGELIQSGKHLRII
ncbi:MAG: hypothetical protein C5B59_05420 [Bacteroidetes bacterium]|nr:MAG: hypothetical protein C5B59_05420 [Bacteroidota bacterium]